MIKKVYRTWNQIDKAVKALAAQTKKIDYVVGVPRGGLVLSVMFSHRAGVKLMTLDHLEMLEKLDLKIDKKKILIIDDISDSGHTLKRFKDNGYTIATIDMRNTSVTKPDYYINWIDNTNWIVYPWEKKSANPIQGYLEK